jgi:hypothetical protein
MAKKDLTDLKKFLKPFPGNVRENALWLREFVWDLYPDSNELIYDNYNALAVGFGLSDKQGDIFCSIPVYANYVHFGFYRGSEITDPKKMLNGKGSLYRYIVINNKADFPQAYIKKLLKEAYANAMARMKLKNVKQVLKGQTITKSISPVKRRPCPVK